MSTHSNALRVISLTVVLGSFGFAWHKFCTSSPPWIRQLDVLGQARKQMLPGTAIICGGSIAGIVAARICADHFEQVIIIDPELEECEKPKTRLMQYKAVHGILALFTDGARRLWPNFDIEMHAAGGRLRQADLHYSGVLLLNENPADKPPQAVNLVMRRPSAQKLVERLFFQHPTLTKTTVLRGTVRSIHASQDGASIGAVTVRLLGGTFVTLDDAALVVDCTGAAQTGLKWLPAAGFYVPRSIRLRYDGNIRYLCLAFDVSPALSAKLPIPAPQRELACVYVYAPHVDEYAAFVMLAITDNDTMELVVGNTSSGDWPQTASEVVPFIAGFRGCNIPVPSWVLETIRLLCDHGNPSLNVIKLPTQTLVRYDSLPAGVLPSNFVAVGDATSQLNPVHGQGFAKAILNGITLNSLLHSVKQGSPSLPRAFSARYFKTGAPALEALWDATRLHDYGSLKCGPMDGETRDTGRFVRWFERKLLTAATQDEEVASALWHVRHMLAADKVLFAPTAFLPWLNLCEGNHGIE
ncbi:hypothetical protein DFH06DRAFT_1320689 [Mycena polygramma]|nr:hypothetical protein DFH06DRAFT_1320689 [Mycena polygramma]